MDQVGVDISNEDLDIDIEMSSFGDNDDVIEVTYNLNDINDDGDDDDDDDDTSIYPSQSSDGKKIYNISKNIIFILFSFVVVSLFLVMSIGSIIYFSRPNKPDNQPDIFENIKGNQIYEQILYSKKELFDMDYWDDGNKKNDGEIYNTIEFQMKLNLYNFANRKKGINDFLDFMSKNASEGLFKFPSESIEENCRTQNRMYLTKCNRQYQLRVRNYFSGPRTGNTTLDIKKSFSDYSSKIDDLNFRPSDEYLDPSFEKIENDIHSCEDRSKFSRETRIKVDINDINSKLVDCASVASYFPYLDIDYKENIDISSNDFDYWASVNHRGFIKHQNDSLTTFSEYKIDFTFSYDLPERAIVGNVVPDSAEMSIRVYGTDNGLGPFDFLTLQLFYDTWWNLLNQYGDYLEWPCVVGEYVSINDLENSYFY